MTDDTSSNARLPVAVRYRTRWAWAVGVALSLVVASCSASGSRISSTISSASPASASAPRPPGASASTPATVIDPVVRIPASPRPDAEPPPAGLSPPPGEQGIAVASLGGMPYAAAPGGEVLGVAHEGLVFGVEERSGDWFGLRDQCDARIWAASERLAFSPRAIDRAPGSLSLDEAVVILDPGHGGANTGATGPSGLAEPLVNLDIARRLRDLLSEPHDIDWRTGAVGPGDAIPAVGAVWLTRVEGPLGADVESGLTYRATLATMAGADALVSIHNNADPDGPFAGPGSEVFYQIADQQSRRLAGLLIEELRRGFADFDVAWVGDTDAGAKYRLRADGQNDYYGLLRGSRVPSVIAEGAFISNRDEEQLLGTAEFRQAYARAVYRSLVRFLTTQDQGSGFTEPYPRTLPAGSGAPGPDCVVPQQP